LFYPYSAYGYPGLNSEGPVEFEQEINLILGWAFTHWPMSGVLCQLLKVPSALKRKTLDNSPFFLKDLSLITD
jgi:hypothetical protein